MSGSTTQYAITHIRPTFAVGVVTFAVAAMLLTAAAPVALSVAIVFLFAGPHNYVEARYFLTRLPARMGSLRGFFLISGAGVILLTVAFPLSAHVPLWFGWPRESLLWTLGLWNTALVLWCTAMMSLRSQQPPRHDWDYAWPVGIGIIGLSWLQPVVLPYLLVYLHPLMGLWVLDREISKRRPEWITGWRRCLWLLPAMWLLLWLLVPLDFTKGPVVADHLRTQIAHHAGAVLFSEQTGQRMIATHAFLELLHYGVWLVAIPLASGRVFSAAFHDIPLMKRSGSVRRLISVGLVISAAVVGVLWLCFAADYATTRDVYFTVAMLHVLAEVPFLLRLL